MYEVFDMRNGATIKWCRTMQSVMRLIHMLDEVGKTCDFTFCDTKYSYLSGPRGW